MASAIVTLNWNDWKNTIDCLESIYQNEGNFDVFLIDNGSDLKNILNISSWYKGQLISDSVGASGKVQFNSTLQTKDINADGTPPLL